MVSSGNALCFNMKHLYGIVFPPVPFRECLIKSSLEEALRKRCFERLPKPDNLNAVSSAWMLNLLNPTSGIALIRGTASVTRTAMQIPR